MTERLDLELAPQLAEIGRLTEQIAAFGSRASLPAAAVHQLTLVLDELVTNVISHGLDPGSTAPITVSLSCQDGVVTAKISDSGRPFDPRTAPTPDLHSPLETRRIGGLGVHFARTMMDEIEYRYADARNHVTLTKRLGKDTT